MPKSRQQKEAVVGEVADRLGRAKGAVFASYEKLPTKDIEGLRKKLEDANIDYTVVKKTLLKLAFERAGVAGDPKEIEGNFATITGYGDEVASAKIVKDFIKTHNAMAVLGGVLEGRLISAQEVLALAALPSRQELLAKMVGSMSAPISGFVNVLAGNLRGLLTALTAIKDQKTA
jgi:large subunit ribosomal protein L10